MQTELQELLELSDLHEAQASRLAEACAHEIFPCDALAFSVLERSLNLLKGFHLLLSNGCYTSGAALLRMQLDSILRFNGIALCKDPHEIASSVIGGVPLRTLKDRSGKKMVDKHLVEIFSKKNPWVEHIYGLSSSYIHLSEQHFGHFIARSQRNEATGMRDFSIGDSDDHISTEHKIELINAFSALTRGIFSAVTQWAEIRHLHGTSQSLRARFQTAV